MLEDHIRYLSRDQVINIFNSIISIKVFNQVLKQVNQDSDAYVKRNLWDKVEVSIYEQIWNQVKNKKI